MKYAVLWVPFVAVALGACAAPVNGGSFPNHILQTESVCSLSGQSPPPSGAMVRVSAFYITDYEERSRLVDPSCPSGLVEFKFDRQAIGPHGGGAYKDIEASIVHDIVDNRRTGVYRISFTGRFVYRKSVQPHAMVDISHVWSFKRMPCTAFYSAAECKGMD